MMYLRIHINIYKYIQPVSEGTYINIFQYIQAVSEGTLWSLDRGVFHQIMVSTGIMKFENQVEFYILSLES